jgi:hypothetical protein
MAVSKKRKPTFTDYFSKGIISDNSNLLRGQLFPKFVIGIGELRLVILRKRCGMTVASAHAGSCIEIVRL